VKLRQEFGKPENFKNGVDEQQPIIKNPSKKWQNYFRPETGKELPDSGERHEERYMKIFSS